MPIRPEMRDRYPSDWPEIRARILAMAENCCEGSPQHPDCRAKNHEPHPITGAYVVLTIGHLDHNPENCADENLRAWCQLCHNGYDMPVRARGRQQRQDKAAGVRELF
ncbi:MAG: hypothetical protein NTU62_13605 [Spirochaetes bacterium]|nr:hypothetical protein [Spirochaetota bacterium]